MTVRAIALAALASFALPLGAGVALAYPAAATTALNVRSGPSTQYAVQGTLQRNERVEVIECNSGWCRLETNRLNGWASARYLTRLEDAPEPAPDAQTAAPSAPDAPEPNVEIAIESEAFAFNIGTGTRPGYRPPSAGLVCFYDGGDFGGREMCAGSGDRDLYLRPSWDNAIRSVRIEGGASATLCDGPELTGQCAQVSQSRTELNALEAQVSSYAVDRF